MKDIEPINSPLPTMLSTILKFIATHTSKPTAKEKTNAIEWLK